MLFPMDYGVVIAISFCVGFLWGLYCMRIVAKEAFKRWTEEWTALRRAEHEPPKVVE